MGQYSGFSTKKLIIKEAELYVKTIETAITEFQCNKLETTNKINKAFANLNECKKELNERGIPVPDRYITPEIIVKIGNE